MSSEHINKHQAAAIQQDWEDREFVAMVQRNIVQIASFLNDFDLTVRTKVAAMNEKLTKLERMVDFCEAAAKSSQDRMSREQQGEQHR